MISLLQMEQDTYWYIMSTLKRLMQVGRLYLLIVTRCVIIVS